MARFLLSRFLQTIITLVVMSVLVFAGVYLVGNPVDLLLGSNATPAERDAVIRAFGLDKTLWQQYLLFVTHALQGDLGNSFIFNQPALHLILQRIPATLELALVAFLLSLLVGIPLGVFAGLRPDSLAAKSVMTVSILGFSLPTFWIGMMMIMLFSVKLGWLPSSGRGETVTVAGVPLSLLTLDGWQHLLLPALNLALFKISLIIRLTRAGVRECLQQDYVRFARAKGLSESRILFVHVLKNTLIPLITVIGLELGSLIAFAVVTETIYAWPGMGKLIIDAIAVLDRPVILAYLMMTVVMFSVINLLVDVLYAVVDPRIRLGGGAMNMLQQRSVHTPSTLPVSRSALSHVLSMLWQDRLARLGLFMLVLIVALALLAPWIAPQNPYDLSQLMIMDNRLPPGSSGMSGVTYWLGSDDQGRDLLSAILYGTRTSLIVGVSSALVALCIGMVAGLLSAWLGGKTDALLMRIVDIQLSFPPILIALILLAVLGQGVDKIILALVITQWAYYARTLRASALLENRRNYVDAARGMAFSTPRILFRHVLPNCLPPLIVVATMRIAYAIMLEATLSFLGIGLPITEPSLGLLIANGFDYLLSGDYWISLFPGVMLLLLIVAINLIGDALRDALNTRQEE
ncbi:hypothetical protein OS31_39780 [Dickeya oryzae]